MRLRGHMGDLCGPCIYSPAPEGACSPTSSSATNLSLQSSGTPTAATSCGSDPLMAGFPVCTSIMAMCVNSTPAPGPAEWISSQRASLARMFQRLAVAPVSQVSAAASFGKSSASSTPSGRRSSGSKTPRASVPKAGAKSSPPSWRVDIPGETEPLPRLTCAPDTNAADGGCLLPTLTVCGNWNRKGASANSGDGLATPIRRLPTLTASSGRQGVTTKPEYWQDSQRGMQLRTALYMLPTICATDYKSPYSEAGYHNQMQKRSKPLRDTLVHTIGHRLTPAFAEWWMGWPLGWTASSVPATGKSRSRRRRPGGV